MGRLDMARLGTHTGVQGTHSPGRSQPTSPHVPAPGVLHEPHLPRVRAAQPPVPSSPAPFAPHSSFPEATSRWRERRASLCAPHPLPNLPPDNNEPRHFYYHY